MLLHLLVFDEREVGRSVGIAYNNTRTTVLVPMYQSRLLGWWCICWARYCCSECRGDGCGRDTAYMAAVNVVSPAGSCTKLGSPCLKSECQ
jgi:hypothetical protein